MADKAFSRRYLAGGSIALTEEEIVAYYKKLEEECGMNTDHADTDKYWANELKLRYDEMPVSYQAQIDSMNGIEWRERIFEMLS